MRLKLLAVAVAILTGTLVSACSSRTPSLEVVLEEYPELRPGIYEELGRWEQVLGAPQTVRQPDGAHTFFYWPDHGIAVFTHPLYEGQYRSKQREARKVTSVILPLKGAFAPSFLPVEENIVIQFDRLLELPRDSAERLRRAESPVSDPCHHVDIVSSPWLKPTERLHVCDGQPVAVEVRDTWWLSHYD